MKRPITARQASMMSSRCLGWLSLGLVLGLQGCNWFQAKSPAPTEPSVQSSPGVPTNGPEGQGQGAVLPSREPSTGSTPAKGNPQTSEPQAALPQSPPLDPKEEKVVAIDDEKVLELVKKTEKEGAIARQDSGKTNLYLILTNLQTERLFQPQFASDLKALPAKIPAQTDQYRLNIAEASATEAYAVAEAKAGGLPSYIGAAYAGEPGVPPIIGICKSNLPSQKAPSKPRLVRGQVVCAKESTAVKIE